MDVSFISISWFMSYKNLYVRVSSKRVCRIVTQTVCELSSSDSHMMYVVDCPFARDLQPLQASEATGYRTTL